MLTVLVVHTCLLLNAPTLLILIVGVPIVTAMMLLSTAVSLTIQTNEDTILMLFTSDSTRIWDTPFTGMMRLRGLTFANQGLVEVYCNGQWGTLCNADFYSSDATTLCRKLGYDDYSSYNHLAM